MQQNSDVVAEFGLTIMSELSLQSVIVLLITAGLSGLLPQHPSTYRNAWRNRREFNMEKLQRQLQEEEEEEEGKVREKVSGEEKT